MTGEPNGDGRLLYTRRGLLSRGLTMSSALLLGACADRAANSGASPTGATGSNPMAAVAGARAAQTTCVASPQLTEGPYFVDEKLERWDIRPDPTTGEMSEGVPLYLSFQVGLIQGGACVPLAGAQFDVWHCDAYGVYSDVSDNIMGTSGVGRKFLRGYQVTDADGIAQFLTIYPGWYQGRAVHIHFKVRSDPTSELGYEFTSQFFFDDAFSNEIFTLEPYAPKGPTGTPNTRDGIFQGSGGLLTLEPFPQADGYGATLGVVLDPTAPAGPTGPGGPPGGPPPR